ncbi:MAG: hypothetical protein JWR74_699 [Polaromonas sp.]|jgi:prepilin peptidase CpaA|nr:hypothetical protein [Polaromonas sp.]
MQLNMSPGTWQLASLLMLALVLLMAVVSDIRERRIPNQLVLLALGAGVFFNLTGPQSAAPGAGMFTTMPGALGASGALLGALAGLALFMPLYLVRATGAGDVKLMAGIGSFTGAGAAVNIALFILLAGGVLSLARMVWAGNSRRVMANVAMALGQMRPGSAGTFDIAAHSADRMPYGVAMAAGVLAYGVWIFSGRQPIVMF